MKKSLFVLSILLAQSAYCSNADLGENSTSRTEGRVHRVELLPASTLEDEVRPQAEFESETESVETYESMLHRSIDKAIRQINFGIFNDEDAIDYVLNEARNWLEIFYKNVNKENLMQVQAALSPIVSETEASISENEAIIANLEREIIILKDELAPVIANSELYRKLIDGQEDIIKIQDSLILKDKSDLEKPISLSLVDESKIRGKLDNFRRVLNKELNNIREGLSLRFAVGSIVSRFGSYTKLVGNSTSIFALRISYQSTARSLLSHYKIKIRELQRLIDFLKKEKDSGFYSRFSH